MSRPLPKPVRELVGNALDEGAIDRSFRGMNKRRRERGTAPAPRRFALVAAAAVAACVALFFVFRAPPTPGALARVDGRALDALEATAGGAARADLTDGSSLEVAPGGRLVTIGNDGARFITLLERGRATLHVQKGGPRAWTIECGLATVDVLGTRLDLDRTDGALRVQVDEGIVLVRGENVPDRARRLVAGESLVVRGVAPAGSTGGEGAPAGSSGSSASSGSGEPSEPGAPVAPSGAPSPAGDAPASTTWRDLAKSGSFREAYDALGDGGVRGAAASSSVDDLFLLADVARLSGHPGEAVGPLERIVTEHAGDGRAGLAALTLARLRLDALGQPGRAAADFETALALGLPGALQEDAMGRAVEARFRAGDRPGGRRVGERYLAQFPEGRHAATVRGLLDEKP